ncbi:MAG TPA: hypothetical protein VGG46_00875 [Terriglobales bacterium]|jgi:hypothetical protein
MGNVPSVPGFSPGFPAWGPQRFGYLNIENGTIFGKILYIMSDRGLVITKIVKYLESELPFLAATTTKYVYTCALAPNFAGWVGLNLIQNRNDGRVGVNSIIGVVSKQIEALLERLSPFDQAFPKPTITTSLGYLMPEKRYQEWLFVPQMNFDYISEAKKIKQAIELYGLPFMNANASLEAITEDLEHLRFSFRESVVYRLPVAYLLGDKTELAMEYVKRQLEILNGRQDDAAAKYRAFGDAFLKEV